MTRIIILFLLVAWGAPIAAWAEIHVVKVVDHEYQPASLTVTEGDTVRWEIVDNFHNMIAGTSSNPTGAFASDILFKGNIFEVDFSRELLNQYPAPGNVYPYYCEPHVLMGMTGTITVLRRTKSFRAKLVPWQAVPPAEGSAVASCALTLSDDETSIAVECDTRSGSLAIGRARLGASGPQLCSAASGATSLTCAVTPEEVDELFGAGLYLESTGNGPAIRGQIVRNGTGVSVSGKVALSSGKALSNVSVSDGSRSALTDGNGAFVLGGVENGVYRLTATLAGYSMSPAANVTPYVVNGSDVLFRSFAATASALVKLDFDGDGVSDAGAAARIGKTAALSVATSTGTTVFTLLEPTVSRLAAMNASGNGIARPVRFIERGGRLIWEFSAADGSVERRTSFGRSGDRALVGCHVSGDSNSDLAVIHDGDVLYQPLARTAGRKKISNRLLRQARVFACGDVDGDRLDEILLATRSGIAAIAADGTTVSMKPINGVTALAYLGGLGFVYSGKNGLTVETGDSSRLFPGLALETPLTTASGAVLLVRDTATGELKILDVESGELASAPRGLAGAAVRATRVIVPPTRSR